MRNGSRIHGLFLVFIFLVTISLVLIVNRPNMRVLAGNVIVVPDDFSSVGLAVSSASIGDTIFVRAGQYIEGDILVDKSLTIVGENSENTTINGNGTASFIFQVIAGDVAIENFTLKRTDTSFFKQGPAIRIFNVTNVNVTNVETREVYHGIELLATNSSMIVDCGISDSAVNGLYIHDTSTNNIIARNTIRNNSVGILLASAGDQFNRIYHNNFINNTSQMIFVGLNYFDNGYASGGNYFSDYFGTDVNYTAGQNVQGSDGIFDEPYLGDNYPFVEPLLGFNVAAEGGNFLVQASTNVTLTSCALNVSTKTLEFQLQTLSNFTGSFRVEIPKVMLRCNTLGEWNVTVWDNGSPGSPSYLLPLEDLNYTYLYFTFNNTATISRIDITGTEVLPEFSAVALMLLFACLTGVFAFAKTIRRKSPGTVISQQNWKACASR